MVTAGLGGYRPSGQRPEHDDPAELARAFFTIEVVPHAARLEGLDHPDRSHYRPYGERCAVA